MTIRRISMHLLLLCLLVVVPITLIIMSSNPADDMAATPAITRQAAPPPTPAAEQTASLPPKLIIGNPTAPVTLIEYGDFQCPFCAQYFRQTEPSILRDYVTPGKINIEFRIETHIGQESIRAGEAAYCANDQNSFKAYHDELFKRRNGENRGAFSDDKLKAIAADLGLSQPAFDGCLNGNKYLSAVNLSNDEAHSRGVTSTPTVFIGDSKVTGAQPYAIYKALIDEQL